MKTPYFQPNVKDFVRKYEIITAFAGENRNFVQCLNFKQQGSALTPS